MKIDLIGPFPPPYGGISIHIKRLYEKLKISNIETKIYCINKINVKNQDIEYSNLKKTILKSIVFNKDEIIHIHNSGLKVRGLISLVGFLFNKKIIMTIHGASLEEEYRNLNKLGKLIYKFLLNKISYMIVVSPQVKEWCIENKILNNKIEIIPGYINPIINKEDYLKIDKEVWDFIESSKSKNEKIITGNGNVRFFNNQDLYGLDLLIELIYLLKKAGYKVSLLFALLGYDNQTQEERNYFEELENRIKKYQIDKEVFIYKVKDTEYYPILDKTDIFIRPTNTDGYGISVTEAIYLKKPAIASDVCQRQKGTIYFKSRDIKDLLEKTKLVLNNYDEEKNKLEKIEVKEYYKDVLEVYKKVYRGK